MPRACPSCATETQSGGSEYGEIFESQPGTDPWMDQPPDILNEEYTPINSNRVPQLNAPQNDSYSSQLTPGNLNEELATPSDSSLAVPGLITALVAVLVMSNLVG